MTPVAVNEGAWVTGLVIGAVVVVLVAALLLLLIGLAASIGGQVSSVRTALEEARDGTEVLKGLEMTERLSRHLAEFEPRAQRGT